MNLLYFSLVNFEKEVDAGVKNKIEGQFNAFRKNSKESHLCYINDSGMYVKYDSEELLIKKSLNFKYQFIEKRIIYYNSILKYIKKTILILYILDTLFQIHFL